MLIADNIGCFVAGLKNNREELEFREQEHLER